MRWLRWRIAMLCVKVADRAEDQAEAALALGLTDREHKHGRRALRAYLWAHRVWPIEHPLQLPSPEDIGSHPADEALWPEETADVRDTIPCIICGTPIRARRHGATEGGMYCERCS